MFSIEGVVPGLYRVVAWEDVEPGAWKNPDFLKAVEERGNEIRVEAGAQPDVSLRVIPLRD